MKTVRFHADAELEILEAQHWYRNRSEVAAQAFVLELDRAIATISKSPTRCPKIRGELRRYVLKRFPYSIIFRIETENIYVTAIAHQRRRPGYWRDR